jgi:hypothetical protein
MSFKNTGKIQKESFGYKQFFVPNECGTVDLPADVVASFEKTSDAQRHNIDCAEDAMKKLQKVLGGGVYSSMVEHCGDLTHRCCHHAKYGEMYPQYADEKITRAINTLGSGYGFEREHKENMISNASFDNVPLDIFESKVADAMSVYAEAHRRIPVFNEIQFRSREAAIALGDGEPNKALKAVEWLGKVVENYDAYSAQASVVYRDHENKILDYDEIRPTIMNEMFTIIPENEFN